MRVLMCCENYPPSVGGVQEVMRQVAERLVALGHTVTVATSAHACRAPDCTIRGVRVLSFPISGNRMAGIRGPVSDYTSLLRSQAYDAILIKAAQQWTFDAAIDVLADVRARKVFIPCGFSALHSPRWAAYYAAMPDWLARFDALIFYSHGYQDVEFARKHELTRLHFIPNGVDEREFADPAPGDILAKLGIAEGHDIVMSVGSLIAAKGHWEVLKAFQLADLPRPATLVVNGNSGAGGFPVNARRFARHLMGRRFPLRWEARLRAKRPDRRVIVVDLPRPDLVALYKAADLFVFASHVEYSPLVLFESAAAGTPFLSARVGNSAEISEWTGAGRIVRDEGLAGAASSPEALAREMSNLMNDRDAMIAMGHRGRDRVMGSDGPGYTWDRIVKCYEEVLRG